MITVNVRVYSALNHYVNNQDSHKWFKFDIIDGSTVAKLINALNIPEKEVMVLKVNDEIKNADYVIQANDSIELYPRLAGG
jgi:molybdopterin converting factor small subunit